MARYVVPEAERMISSREAAPILGVSRQTIDRLADRGVIPSHRAPGTNRITYRVGDLFAMRADTLRFPATATKKSSRRPR